MTETPPPTEEFDPQKAFYEPSAKAWWEYCLPEEFLNEPMGCLLFFLCLPFLLISTSQDGKFRFVLVDIACVVVLMSALLALRTNVTVGLPGVEQVGMTFACGLIVGLLVSIVRRNVLWIGAGLSMATWVVLIAWVFFFFSLELPN